MLKLKEEIQKVLYKSVDSSSKNSSRYFKTNPGQYAEFDKFLGIKSPTVRNIAKKYQNISLPTIEHFLKSEFNEVRFFALVVLIHQYKKSITPTQQEKIYSFYLKNINFVNNWNLIDNSAHHIIGAHLYNRNREILLEFAKSQNMWKRRIAIVSTLHFIKKQDFKCTIDIVKILINDPEDLIHKACGWMLREIGKQDEEKLINFLNIYCLIMPRTMLRYSIERLSEPTRKNYLLSVKHLDVKLLQSKDSIRTKIKKIKQNIIT